MGRVLVLFILASGWSGLCAYLGALVQKRRDPAHLVMRERRQLLSRITKASKAGLHGEVELLERELAATRQPTNP